jgi:O-acetyl-ADP-ribose deacetylase (regulator of RNase III)
LQLELEEKWIVDIDTMDVIERNMVLYQWDITTIKADAIVNAWNNYWLWCFVPNHLCIDNAIHTYAWMRLRLECNEKLQWRTIKNWDILVCKWYNLPSKYVITTVWPEIHWEITKIDESDLALCYQNSLEYAVNNNFKSIVFPSISTWLFWYPIDQAKIISYKTVKEFLKKNENIKVCFNVFSNFDYEQYRELFNH